MWTDKDLPADIAQRAKAFCDEGDRLADQKSHHEAIQKFSEAFKLLPEPKHRWLAATWILIAIGDTAFLAGDLSTATEALREIGLCEGWHTNPFARLRRGQVALENGDTKKASDELASAFMLGGYQVFEREDPKYAEFILSQLHPPVPPVDHPLARFHLIPGNGRGKSSSPGKKPWWKIW